MTKYRVKPQNPVLKNVGGNWNIVFLKRCIILFVVYSAVIPGLSKFTVSVCLSHMQARKHKYGSVHTKSSFKLFNMSKK